MTEISISLKDSEQLREVITKLLLEKALLQKEVETLCSEMNERHRIMMSYAEGLSDSKFGALCSELKNATT